jgi:putative MATE family efflux protein
MNNLTEGNILQTLLKYSYPIIIGDMLQAMFSVIDALWVGRLIGSNALAAISAVGPIMFLMVTLVIGVSIATVIMVGQAYGKGDTALLDKILVNSYMTVFVMCLLITAFSIIFIDPLLQFINTPADIRKDARTFIVIIFSGLIFIFSFDWFSGVLRGLGDSKTPFILQVIMLILNVMLAPLLITGTFGLPRLGIAGSALATVISQFITVIIAFIYLAKKNVMLNVLKWKFKPDLAVIKKMFMIGVPVSVQLVINAVSAVIIVGFVNKFGSDVIAGYGIGMRIDQFSFLPAMSLGSAVSAMTAQHIGSGKKDMIPEIMKNAMLISLGFAAVFYIPVNIFSDQIAGIFSGRVQVWDAVRMYWHIDSLTYFAFAMMFAFQGVIRGAGDTVPLTIFAFVSLIIFRTGIAWVLIEKTQLKEVGIWIGMTISVYIGAGISYWYYKASKWNDKTLIKSDL